jgi:hypothetical protein
VLLVDDHVLLRDGLALPAAHLTEPVALVIASPLAATPLIVSAFDVLVVRASVDDDRALIAKNFFRAAREAGSATWPSTAPRPVTNGTRTRCARIPRAATLSRLNLRSEHEQRAEVVDVRERRAWHDQVA